MNMRIGHGYDVHRLVEGRRCIIGGVDIPFELGLDGHSDADVLTHAVMDALWARSRSETSAGIFLIPIRPTRVRTVWLCCAMSVRLSVKRAGRSATSTQPCSRRRPNSRRISCRCARILPLPWNAMSTVFPSRRRLRKSWASPVQSRVSPLTASACWKSFKKITA